MLEEEAPLRAERGKTGPSSIWLCTPIMALPWGGQRFATCLRVASRGCR